MKKLGLLLACILLIVSGCSSTTTQEDKVESKVVSIGVDDAINKIEKKQTFILLVTRKKCEYCEALLETLDATIDEHKVVIYNAVMRDDTVDNLNADVDKLKNYLERPDQTPHYYYIVDGEVMDAEMGYTSANPNRFWDWISKNDVEGLQ